MESFIKNFCGEWKNNTGNRLQIKYKNNSTALVTFYMPDESHPMLRPWCSDKPATSMVGTLDTETEAELDIDLSDNTNSFKLNLSFDISDSGYNSCVPSIIRNEDEGYLDQYYYLIGSLNRYEKC